MQWNPSATRPAAHLFLIAITGLLAYSNSFHVPFFLDDEGSIINNAVIHDLGRFLSGDGYAYNPRRFLGYLSLALNYRIGGLDVAGYHVFNLIVHILSAWLVYWLSRLTLQTPFFAEAGTASGEAPTAASAFVPLAAALFFVAHPVQTQAVTYIVQRLASLATLFFVLSLACYAKARLLQEAKQRMLAVKPVAFHLLALLAAGCAMKTKEIAFTLPIVIILYEFLFFKVAARHKALFLAPVALMLLVIPASILGTGHSITKLISDTGALTRVETDIPRLDYLLTQFPVIATYIRLLFLPINQNLDYDIPVYSSLLYGPVLWSLLPILALLVWALFALRRRSSGSPLLRLISFGILWFFITLSVESSIIPIADVIYEHRVYLPSVGAFIALASLAALFMRAHRPKGAFLTLGVLMIALAGATFARNQVWGSHVSLWSDVVKKSPHKARPHYNLALALEREQRVDEALRHAVEAVRLAPREAYAYNLIGAILGKAGNYERAEEALREAVRLDPLMTEARVNLGDVYRLTGLPQQALLQYEAALKLTPTAADIYHKIGKTHAMNGNLDKAETFFQCAVSLNPGRPEFIADLRNAKEGLSGR